MQSNIRARRFAICASTLFYLLAATALGGAAIAQTPGAAPPFQSPYNGEKPADSVEGSNFANLMNLYDAMKDAEAALKGAQTCKSGVAQAQAAFDAANTAYQDAFDEYVVGWDQSESTHLSDYQKNHSYLHKELQKYRDSAKILTDELVKRDKKQHVAGPCPANPGETTPQPPPTTPSTPAQGCTTKTQEEIDDEIAKATAQLLDTMKRIRVAEDGVLKDEKDIASWNSRMGAAGDQQLKDYKASLNRHNFELKVFRNEAATESQALGALKALKPCPEGHTAPPPSTKPDEPPLKPKSSSDSEERPEIGSRPSPQKDPGVLGEILGHVSIGIGVGASHKDHDRTDRPTSTRVPASSGDGAPRD